MLLLDLTDPDRAATTVAALADSAAAEARRRVFPPLGNSTTGRGLDPYRQPIGDAGLFGPRSVTWGVHAGGWMAPGGIAAVLLQTLHPTIAAGVTDHSSYRTDPLGRLHRTAEFVYSTTYGPTAYAERALATLNRVHRRVVGVRPDGVPYDANDPDSVTWVHATEVYGFLRARQRYGLVPLSKGDADRYVDEMAVIGEGLGGRNVPRSTAELRALVEATIPELRNAEQAQEINGFILAPKRQRNRAAALARQTLTDAGISLLPPAVIELMGRRVPNPLEQLALDAAARLAVRAMDTIIGPTSQLTVSRQRMAGLVAVNPTEDAHAAA